MSSQDKFSKNPAGRPQKTTADRIRTLAWIRCVLSKSKKSPVQLGKEFHPEQYRYDGEKQKSSKRWERYEEGNNFPPDPKAGNSLIDLVDLAYPGTAWVYRHTAWTALGGKIKTTQEVTALLLALEKHVTDICFVPEEVRGKTTLKRTQYDYGLPVRLVNLQSLDGLAALLLLAKEMELTGNGRAHAQVFIMVSENLFYLRDIPEIRAVLPEIVDCLNNTTHSFSYHFGDHHVLPAPTISLEAILGDAKHFWPKDNNTPLEYQLLDQLTRLFGSSELLSTWCKKHHSILGEAPIEALRHSQGLRAIQALLVG